MRCPDNAAPVYRLQNVVRQWGQDDSSFRLRIPDLTIHAGEHIAVTGVSGSGKSTLLDMLGLVLNPSSADRFDFQAPGHAPSPINRMWDDGGQDDLTDLRKHHLGYVLQTGALLGFLNVRQNISLSSDILGQIIPGVIEDLAGRLGIRHHLDKMPSELSIGERQRVAIARAVAHQPPVILADEPTASLDPDTATTIMNLFLEIAEEHTTTLIIVSHDWDRVAQLGFRQLVPEIHGATAVVKG